MIEVPQQLVTEVHRLYVELAPVDLQAACTSLDKLVTAHGPATVGRAVALVAEHDTSTARSPTTS